jgi:class 3 adenylate cyclase/tetratricopeptide (TPR) repeat protein
LPATAKFCPQCAYPVGAAPAPTTYTPRHLVERILDSRDALEDERKQVTVLFADLKGSMELLAERDPEDARKLVDPVLKTMMDAVHHYEGTVNQVMGDGIMALFGAPVAHEDHAIRGCYAALRMQDMMRSYTEQLRRDHGIEMQIRVGLNSGEVVVRSIGSDLRMDYSAVGQTTHLAARMEQLATPGTIRLTANTLSLAEGFVEVKAIGPIPVKGMTERIEIYELSGASAARTRLQATREGGLTRFVGRETELDSLRHAAEQASAGRGQLVAVVGEAGVGKSRLYHEFVRSHWVAGWRVLESGSMSYGRATPLAPLADLLRSYFKVDTRDDVRAIRAKVTGGLLTLDEALKDAVPVFLWLLDALPENSPFLEQNPAERRRLTLAAVKRTLLRESELHPVLVVFEDLHWIDSETQALLDSLVESLPVSRILLAVNYRTEYRHSWGNKASYLQIRIDPLPPESAESLLDSIIGTDPGTDALKKLLIARTQGSPLFLEETVRTLVETRALVGARGGYRRGQAPDTFQVPATVQAILAARIDRLDPAEKRLLQAAAVIGTHIPFALLRAIAGIDDESLRRSLAQLQSGEFLYEAQLFPDLEYAFKHALTHEVAYGSVLQDRKVALHAGIVKAIEELYAGRLSEHIELLAHHATRGRDLPKAVRYLTEAGSKAIERTANYEAIAYFDKALALLAEMPETKATLKQELGIRMALGPALISVKGAPSPEVEQLYRRAVGLVDDLEDKADTEANASRFPALWGQWYVSYTRGDLPAALNTGERLLVIARKEDDTGRILEAHHSLWPVLFMMGRSRDALHHMDEGIGLYDRERHGRMALLYAGHDPAACGYYHRGQANWLLGNVDDAMRDAQEACRLAEELKHPQTMVNALWHRAWIQYQCGARELAIVSLTKLTELAQSYDVHPLLGHVEMFCRLISEEQWSASALRELWNKLRASLLAINSARWIKCQCLLAEICAKSGSAEIGFEILNSIPDDQRQAFIAPELLRIEGELLLKQTRPSVDEAALRFKAAIDLAKGREERALELRAAISLARLLLNEKGRRIEAGDALFDICDWFPEEVSTEDLKEARKLLKHLS